MVTTARHNFSLIEIMIALGIVLVGICSVMVLFPIGANASRDAAVEIESSQVAEQFLGFIKYLADNNPGDVGNYIASSKPTDESDISASGSWTQLSTGSGLDLMLFHDGSNRGVFQYLSIRSEANNISSLTNTQLTELISNGATGSGGNEILIDKRFILKAWYESHDTHSAKLNVEVSWPADAPSANRQKSEYVMQLTY